MNEQAELRAAEERARRSGLLCNAWARKRRRWAARTRRAALASELAACAAELEQHVKPDALPPDAPIATARGEWLRELHSAQSGAELNAVTPQLFRTRT